MKLYIRQERGKDNLCTACMGSPVVPRIGEWVSVFGTAIAGRVKEVKYEYLSLKDAPRELDTVAIDLEGWAHGFGKD